MKKCNAVSSKDNNKGFRLCKGTDRVTKVKSNKHLQVCFSLYKGVLCE